MQEGSEKKNGLLMRYFDEMGISITFPQIQSSAEISGVQSPSSSLNLKQICVASLVYYGASKTHSLHYNDSITLHLKQLCSKN